MRATGVRFRLLVLVLVALLPGLGLILYAAAEQRAQLGREALRQVSNTAAVVAGRVQSRLDVARGVLVGLSTLPAARGGPGCPALLASTRRQTPELANIVVISAAGDLVCSAVPAPSGVNVRDRAYYVEALRVRRLVTSGYIVSRSARRPVYDLVLPLLDDGGAVEALLLAELDLEGLDAVLGAGLPADYVAALADEGAILLARWPEGARYRGRKRVTSVTQAAPIEAVGQDGVRRLYAASPLEVPGAPAAPLVVVGVPPERVYAPVRELLQRSLAFYGVVALLALLAALATAEWAFVRPIADLTGVARRLGAGDYRARTGRRGGGELGELAGAFDELARTLEELRQVEEQLRHAQKLEAVGQLAGGIAHDFNNLLTVILSFVRLAQASLEETNPARADLDEALGAAERAAALTRRLLAFARRDVAVRRVLDLGAAVREVDAMLRRVLGPRVELRVDAPEGLAVRADAGQLEQVLMNLSLNARDAMPDGGRLGIVVREVRDPEARDAELSPPLVAVEVSDTGIGMDRATLSRIFEPFFTTKAAGKGTGLGLSTVYGIVRQAGGTVRVRSAPGEGSTFVVYLPRVRDAPGPAAQPARAAPEGRGETVLVVEDDEAVRRFAIVALERAGYRVRAAARPSEAARLAQEHGPFDLLVSDVLLPEESGPALAARLRDRVRRVLFVSGYTAGHLDAEGVLPAGVEFLAKPFGPEALLRRVREVLDARAA